jgi:hypothetical protein
LVRQDRQFIPWGIPLNCHFGSEIAAGLFMPFVSVLNDIARDYAALRKHELFDFDRGAG